MKRKPEKTAKPRLFGAHVTFPDRVWEPGENGWTSRPVTASDVAARKEVAKLLGVQEAV